MFKRVKITGIECPQCNEMDGVEEECSRDTYLDNCPYSAGTYGDFEVCFCCIICRFRCILENVGDIKDKKRGVKCGKMCLIKKI